MYTTHRNHRGSSSLYSSVLYKLETSIASASEKENVCVCARCAKQTRRIMIKATLETLFRLLFVPAQTVNSINNIAYCIASMILSALIKSINLFFDFFHFPFDTRYRAPPNRFYFEYTSNSTQTNVSGYACVPNRQRDFVYVELLSDWLADDGCKHCMHTEK